MFEIKSLAEKHDYPDLFTVRFIREKRYIGDTSYPIGQLSADMLNVSKESMLKLKSLSESFAKTIDQKFFSPKEQKTIPIEIKGESNLKAKSLKTYCEKFQPEMAVRTSMADYKKGNWFIRLPLYAVKEIPHSDLFLKNTPYNGKGFFIPFNSYEHFLL